MNAAKWLVVAAGVVGLVVGTAAQAALVKEIADDFGIGDPTHLNDNIGNLDWYTPSTGTGGSGGWSVTGGVLANDGTGTLQIGTRNQIPLPGNGILLITQVQLATTGGAQLRFGITNDFGGPIDALSENNSLIILHDTRFQLYHINGAGTWNLIDSETPVPALAPGFYRLEADATTARVFYSTTVMPDGLGTPMLSGAHDINWNNWSNGGAYGYIRYGAGSFDNYLLRIPEPASLSLLALAGLVAWRHRR